MLPRLLVLVMITLSVSTTRSQGAQDDCSEPLRILQKAQTVIKIDTKKTSDKNVLDWFCSKGFEKYVDNLDSGAEATIPINGVPIPFKGHFNNSSSNERRNEFCSLTTKNFSTQDLESIYTQFIPEKAALEALHQFGLCKEKANALGSFVRVDLIPQAPNNVGVYVRFAKPVLPPNSGKVTNPKILKIVPAGMKCSGDQIHNGAEITEQGLTEVCSWNAKEDASLLLVHNSGMPISKTLPFNPNGTAAGTAVFSVKIANAGWYTEEVIRKQLPMDLKFCVQTNLCKFQNPDNYYIRVATGRLTPLQVRCVKDCDHAPDSEYGMFCHSDEEGDAVAVCVVHWKQGAPFKAPTPPYWEYVTEWKRFRPEPIIKEEAEIQLIYGQMFSVSVPTEYVSAELHLTMLGGAKLTIVVTGDLPNDAPLERAGNPQPAGDHTVYTFKVKPPQLEGRVQ